MTLTQIIIGATIVFLIGFELGRRFMIKGLTLRAEQLYNEGDLIASHFLKRVLEDDDNE